MENQSDPNNINQANPTPTEPIGPNQQPPIAEEALNTQQPVQPTPQQTPQYTAPQQPQGSDPGRGYGIASLVTALLGISLVAIVLGIVGLLKSKKAGYSTNIFALIGIIWSVVSIILLTMLLVFLVLGNFQGAQSKGRDTVTKNDINSVYQKLEEYSNNYGSYPASFTAETFPGIDSSALIDNNGDTFKFGDTTVTSLTEAESQDPPTINQLYQYLPYSCLGDDCGGYVVRAYLENDTIDVYTKYSLMNY
jgi:type II secretory pathway pseudopilin PulG